MRTRMLGLVGWVSPWGAVSLTLILFGVLYVCCRSPLWAYAALVVCVPLIALSWARRNLGD